MTTEETNSESFNETQSLQVIKEMIQVSQKKLKNDGILFILWGWLMFYVSITGFLFKKFSVAWHIQNLIGWSAMIFLIAGLIFTIYYLIQKRKKLKTYIGISLRYVWLAMLGSLILINLIQHNILHKTDFLLQQSIYMVVIGYAVITTGAILRHGLITIGGVAFALLALLASYSIANQFLIEAIAWLIAFVIPGHILYAKRRS